MSGGRIGVLLAGCGGYAARQARAFRAAPGVELFFTSRDPERARRYAARFGGTALGPLAAACREPRVDAVIVLSPHDRHLPEARVAARAGKAILVEKPLARSTAEARRIVAAARAGGAVLMLAENYAFLPVLAGLREAGRRLGGIRGVDFLYRRDVRVWGWRTFRRRMGGGILIDMGVHAMRLVQELMGPARAVRTLSLYRPRREMEGESAARVELAFTGGRTARLRLAWEPCPRTLQRVVLSCRQGRAEASLLGRSVTLRTGKETRRLPVAARDARGRRALASAFIGSLRGRRDPYPGAREGLQDLAAVEAAYRSARAGGRWEEVRA